MKLYYVYSYLRKDNSSYTIENIKTKKIIETNNLRMFCRENDFNKTGLSNTLLGKSKNGKTYSQYKGYRIIKKELVG
jgi:hypothetical protein